jgi:hypothetical protein
MWFGLVIGFMDHLQFITTSISNYRAIANSYTQLFTTAYTKTSQFAVSPQVVAL